MMTMRAEANDARGYLGSHDVGATLFALNTLGTHSSYATIPFYLVSQTLSLVSNDHLYD